MKNIDSTTYKLLVFLALSAFVLLITPLILLLIHETHILNKVSFVILIILVIVYFVLVRMEKMSVLRKIALGVLMVMLLQCFLQLVVKEKIYQPLFDEYNPNVAAVHFKSYGVIPYIEIPSKWDYVPIWLLRPINKVRLFFR